MKIVTLFSVIFFIIFGTNFVSADDDDEFWNNWLNPAEFNLFPTLPIAVPFSEDKKCREESRALILNLKNKTFWASQMWDASATSTFGILHGNRYHLGNFDECLAIEEPIKSQYCLVNVKATIHAEDAHEGHPYDLDPMPHVSVWKKIQDSRRDIAKNPRDLSSVGLCVPRSCTPLEIEKNLNLYLKSINEKALKSNGTTYEVTINNCSDNEVEPMTYGEIGFWAFSVLLVLLVFVSTVLDFAKKKDIAIEKWLGYQLLMSFSLRRNAKKFVTVSDSSEAKYFKIMHGIKCVSAALIVLDHHILLFMASALFNIQKVEKLLFFSYQKVFVPHGDLLVDTFFFISGFLVTYGMLSYMEKKRLNFFLAIFQRIIRLAPLYFYLIWFQASVVHRFGSGPAWKYRQKEEAEYCQKNFWASLLFIQNYVNYKEMCFIHAWYIPCDLHFLIMALILIILIKKNEKVGLSVLYVITAIAFAVPGVVTYVYKVQPLMLFTPEFLEKPRLDSSFSQLYIKSHTRAIVYLMAMITGYFFHKYRDSTWKITTFQSLLSCFFGLLLLFIPMVYGSTYFSLGKAYNVTEAVIFTLLRRPLWGLAWVFIMIAMRFGVIPIFGKILSLKFFQILGKLVYGIYLIHFINQIGEQSITHIPKHFVTFSTLVQGLCDFILAAVYALIFYLILELPFKTLITQLLFPSNPNKEDKRNTISISQGNKDPESGRIYTIKL